MNQKLKEALKVLADYCQEHEKCKDCELEYVCRNLAANKSMVATYDLCVGD